MTDVITPLILDNWYGAIIVALLPLTAIILVGQANPYYALVLRGILGAIAALVYALMGAADVALTEALVGTMLSITLYAIAVRSSLSMQTGIVVSPPPGMAVTDCETAEIPLSTPAHPLEAEDVSIDHPLRELRKILDRHHMRLEVRSYPSLEALHTALVDKEVHTICIPTDVDPHTNYPAYRIETRVQRLHAMLSADLPPSTAVLAYTDVAKQTINSTPTFERTEVQS